MVPWSQLMPGRDGKVGWLVKVTNIRDHSARTCHSEGWTPWPRPEGRRGPAKGMSDIRDPQVTCSSDSPPESGLCLRGGLPAPNLCFLSIKWGNHAA